MFSEKIHRYIFLFGLFGLAFGMMIGAVPTSIPQFILAGNWLAEGDFKRKWLQVKNNKVFWIILSVFVMHALGLAYSQDLQTGLNDLKIKLPLLTLPIVFFTAQPLSRKEFYTALYFFILGCVANTLWCITYSFVLHPNELIRNASRFMSHIRLGLYLNVAIAACVYFAWISATLLKKAGWISLVIYFVFVLYVLGLASGLVNFAILFLLTLCVFIYRQNVWIKLAGLLILAGFIALTVNYVAGIHTAQLKTATGENNVPQTYATSGRLLIHLEKGGQKENGNYIYINIQPEELQRAWKKDFPTDSFNYSLNYNLERYIVLVRYMSSKALTKDSVGYSTLTAADKQNIQAGTVNYQYPSWSNLHKRTYELVNEYDEFVHNRFVNGHSLTMRLYFWNAACHLITQHVFFGVGTGDIQQELIRTYIETKSPLEKEWYKRPHNQLLSITAAFGIIGLLIFLTGIIFPVVSLKAYLPKLFWPFFLVAMLSFFLEDTLDTQAGCTFYAFFNSLFLWWAWCRKTSGTGSEHSLKTQQTPAG